jgi:hypothetical protein
MKMTSEYPVPEHGMHQQCWQMESYHESAVRMDNSEFSLFINRRSKKIGIREMCSCASLPEVDD